MILKFSIEALMKSERSGCFTRVTLKTGYSGDVHPVFPAICTHLLNYHFLLFGFVIIVPNHPLNGVLQRGRSLMSLLD